MVQLLIHQTRILNYMYKLIIIEKINEIEFVIRFWYQL